MVVADAELRANFLEYRDFAPARRSADDGFHFSVAWFVIKLCAMNIFRRHNAFERRLDNFLRCGGNHMEIRFISVRESVQSLREQLYVMLQTNQFAGFNQMFAPNAAKFRIMQNQVGKLRALLHQVDLRQTANLVVKALYADQFGKHYSRIIETERLVKIASQ